jgi:protein O-mannosyl-transferase
VAADSVLTPYTLAVLRSPSFLAVLVACLVVAVVHWPVLSAGALSIDDHMFLTANPRVLEPSFAAAWDVLREVSEPRYVKGYYIPLPELSLMLDGFLGGSPENLTPFHVTNLLLHVVNVALVVLVVYGARTESAATVGRFSEAQPFGGGGGFCPGSVWVACAVGLLFGLHPLTVEPVAWIAGRKTLLAGCFGLASLLAWLGFVRSGAWRARYGSLALLFLALLSHPTAVVWPLLLSLLDFWPLRRGVVRRLREKWPHFALAFASAVVTLVSHGRSGGLSVRNDSGVIDAAISACQQLFFYGWKVVWPLDLSPVYTLSEPSELSSPARWGVLSAAFAILAALALAARKWRAPLVGVGFFVVALVPTLGFIQYSWVRVSDTYVYLPSVGILLVVGWASAAVWVRSASGRAWLRWSWIAAVVLFASFETLASRSYLRCWRDSETLYQRMLAIAPDSAAVHDGAANLLSAHGLRRREATLAHRRKAVELEPATALFRYNLGNELARQGEPDGAIRAFREACELDPEHLGARVNLAHTFFDLGRYEEAASCYREAMVIAPDSVVIQADLGNCMLLLGRATAAIPCYESACELAPDDADLRYRLGLAYARAGRTDEARAILLTALRLDPAHGEAGLLLKRL